jgi:hypothetical protein
MWTRPPLNLDLNEQKQNENVPAPVSRASTGSPNFKFGLRHLFQTPLDQAMFSFVRGAASLTSSLLSGVAGVAGSVGSGSGSGFSTGDQAQRRREVATLQNRLRNAQVRATHSSRANRGSRVFLGIQSFIRIQNNSKSTMLIECQPGAGPTAQQPTEEPSIFGHSHPKQ